VESKNIIEAVELITIDLEIKTNDAGAALFKVKDRYGNDINPEELGRAKVPISISNITTQFVIRRFPRDSTITLYYKSEKPGAVEIHSPYL